MNVQVENLYQPQNIIKHHLVHLRFLDSATSSELEITLDRLNPTQIILVEPYLDCIRCVEVYCARRRCVGGSGGVLKEDGADEISANG